MVVQVTIIQQIADSKLVRVSSPWGDLVASWEGGKPVEVGASWLVEIDTQRSYDWSDVVVDSPKCLGLEQLTPKSVRLVGKTVELDVEDLLVIQLDDSSVTVGVVGKPRNLAAGRTVEIVVDDLEIWPHDRV